MTGFEQYPQINVYAKDSLVGTVYFEQPRVCHFRYDAAWMATGYPVSPHMPFSGHIESETVIHFIRNLFPEGHAFDVLLETQNLSKNNLYAILNAIGQDTAGALTFRKVGQDEQSARLRPVTEEELARRLDTQSDMTVWDGKFRLSVAGVQNKLNIYRNVLGDLFLADGAYSSTHILKFSSGKFPTVTINELYCMRLAAAAGLNVAQVGHKKLGDHSALIVERFDRRMSADGVDKRHLIDGCQALDLPPEYKYEQNFGGGSDVSHIRDGASLSKLFAFTAKCSVPAHAVQVMTDWVLFNLIIGNSDAHGKNISFFVGANGLSITPFYDLVSVVFEAEQQEKLDTNSAMAIGDNFDMNTISAFDLLTMADEAGIKFDLLKRRLDRLIHLCRTTATTLDFSQERLSSQQLKTIRTLSRFVDKRCAALSAQSGQFGAIIPTAFGEP